MGAAGNSGPHFHLSLRAAGRRVGAGTLARAPAFATHILNMRGEDQMANENDSGNIESGGGTGGGTGGTGPTDAASSSGRPAGAGQGDDLANKLGGGDGNRSGMTGAAGETGDMSAGRSEDDDAAAPAAAGAGGPSAGDVGGMGGAGASTAGSSRPPGGVSPVQNDDGQ